MAVRMKDIARDLGVSVGDRLESPTEITRTSATKPGSDVLKRMKELDYQPNLAARALVTGRTFTTAWWVPIWCILSLGMAKGLPARCVISRAMA